MNHLILASTSPRRREILALTGLPFEVLPPDYEEDNTLPLAPAELVKHLALGKANSVAGKHPRAVIIGADTLVAAQGQVLGKPRDPADVVRMISMLSGRWHSVFTGLAILEEDRQVTDVIETRVHFRTLSSQEVERYATLTNIYGFAGAYGFQTAAGVFVDRIEGDYFNAIGLPLSPLATHLEDFGFTLPALGEA